LSAQTLIGQLGAADASVQGGVVVSAGATHIVSGSIVGAGKTTAWLHLARGGDVRICPHSSLTVTSSPNGQDLLLAIAGSMETHYRLGSSADAVLTPDFRIALTGPGDFHFAVASDAAGNTCVRTFPEDTATAIVNELMGNGVYPVHPGDQVLFHRGSTANPDLLAPPDCGCPREAPAPVAGLEPATGTPAAGANPGAGPGLPTAATGKGKPIPPGAEVQVSVDAPFVYSAAGIPPVPAVARIDLQMLPRRMFVIPLSAIPQPPPGPEAAAPPAARPSWKKDLLHHLHSALSAVYE
jgi:hypothetical protein